MIHAKRSRLSPAEKNHISRRWKCGQSLHEIGRAYGKPILPSAVCCCLVAVSLLPLLVVRCFTPTEFADIVKRPISSLEVHPTRKVI